MSNARAQPLNATQAARFTQAQRLLQSGQPAQALAIAEALAVQAPLSADAWQLLGMCRDGNGQPTQAIEAFEQALALLPGNALVARNYAVLLARYGKALRAQEDWQAAEPILRKALHLSPAQVSAWVDLGVVLRFLGRLDEALAAFQQAQSDLQRRGIAQPDVLDAINGVLADAGRTAEALQGARRLVAAYPAHAPAHETLGNLLWENGSQYAPGEDPLAAFGAAALAQPDNRALQFAFARMLLATKRPQEALALLQPIRQREPGNGVLDWFVADALDALQQHQQAGVLYAAAAHSELAQHADFLNARARHAFRTQDIDLAAACAESAVKHEPHNQEGWSHLGTAWRLMGDQREHWLCDYQQLVGFIEVAPPAGFADMPAFLHALTATLEAMHNAGREPINQSVRGGTQTTGLLFGRDDRVIHAAEAALRAAVEQWLASLPDDPHHPFLARKQPSIAFAGSWSVRLAAAGRHSNHIHGKGWMSSAFYVALPDSVRAADASTGAGAIQFGQPLEDLGLDLPPRRIIQPKPGYLALFPSYFWHGTVPFDAETPRLTIAFDGLPKRHR